MVSLEKQILYMIQHRHEITASELIHIYKDRGKSKQTIRNALSTLKQKGYILSKDRKYTLTESGAGVIRSLQLKISGENKAWDGRWHFVMFSIPEQLRSLRNTFRRELVQIGYGLLYDGVFICPYNRNTSVLEVAKRTGLEEWIRMGSVELEYGPITASLAEQIWPVQTIHEKYDQFIEWANVKLEEWSALLNPFTVVSPWNVLLQVLELGERFGEILLEDPFLPKELLPENWLMEKAWDLYDKHLNQLIPLLRSDSHLFSLIVPVD
ncbi:hypothetical protein PSTEL_11235 [Paenibacillus stellifer]|uniref:PaaX-like C-terminal domain-containing protein n=1 Tax=Paenibacillus stellifer TaxID=169760 RepID=A0A089LTW9_9BACL|nr:PaaX family transcriptional regulator C-terminal domain-containing protein [Paenibacillus stellifer]AIQ63570.1 hypothetical protein PSTEL_11235 [Paenibacillus stellifer]